MTYNKIRFFCKFSNIFDNSRYSDHVWSSNSHIVKRAGMLLNVVFESWVLEHISVLFNGVHFLSGNSLCHVFWMLVQVLLNIWVLKNGVVIFGTGFVEGIVEELNSWLLGPEMRLFGDDDSWVGVGVVGDDDSWVGGRLDNDDWLGNRLDNNDWLGNRLMNDDRLGDWFGHWLGINDTLAQ